jgi:hypothetical protein
MSIQAEIDAALAAFVADVARIVRKAALEHVRQALAGLRGGPDRPDAAPASRPARVFAAAGLTLPLPLRPPVSASPRGPQSSAASSKPRPSGAAPTIRSRGLAPVAPAAAPKPPPRLSAHPGLHTVAPSPKTWAPMGPMSNYSPWAPPAPPEPARAEPRRRGRPPGRKPAPAPVEAPPPVVAEAAEAPPADGPRRWVVRRPKKDRPEGAEPEAKPIEADAKPADGAPNAKPAAGAAATPADGSA